MSAPVLFDVQRKTVDYGIKNPYVIYALEQGVGKSVCALVTAHETNSKLLIICPSYLMYKWKKEIQKFFPDKRIDLLENDRAFYRLWDTDIAIISYHFVPKSEILFEWADMVVWDEAHYLKNPDSKRSDAAHRLIFENSIKRCVFLTGTPIQNRVYEFWSLIAMCNYDPRITESPFLTRFPTYVEFANHFSYLNEFHIDKVGKDGKWKRVPVRQWSGYRNVEELKHYLKDCYIRFKLSDVVELPPSINIEVPVSYVDMPDLEREFDRFVDTDGDTTGVSSPVKVKAAVLTAPFTAQYVFDLLEQDRMVVVFTDHPEAAEIIAHKLNTDYIDGTVDVRKRQKMADEFQAGERKVIVATIGSFSTGIDLFASQDLVFNDLPWRPSDEDQAKSRIKRIGQTGRCINHYIYGTIQSQKIREKLNQKREAIEAVV